MRMDRDGYLYFVDRIGDTFRFKGENVATTEVAEFLAQAPGVAEIVVYGVEVPGLDGKVGMAAIVAGADFDLKAFYATAEARLPAFARPRFVRLLSAFDTTGTFKYKKTDLVREGFDPSRTKDKIYILNEDGYVPLTKARTAEIKAGTWRF